MEDITIIKETETKTGWEILVEVGSGGDAIEYGVEVDEDYWQEITDEEITPAEMVEKSFEFLLEREPKEAILKHFNLQIISSFFSEYEQELVRRL